MERQRQRFGLRKLSIGVASVLLGTTFIFGEGTVAHADETVSTQPTVEEQTASNENVTTQQLQAKPVALNSVASTPAVKQNETAKVASDVKPSDNSSQEAPTQTSKATADTILSSRQVTNVKPTINPIAESDKTISKMSQLDNTSVSVDVSNAKVGDTYSLVFHKDPHLTLGYTPGSFSDSTVVKTSTSNNQDGDEVYTGTFLKDGTINQPIVFLNFKNKLATGLK
ncbi:YSIRK-type signal peptide-containing protein [Limosilactobacillus sp.]|uniref:YSIRK-type signal peptide-containing protein n=1 Tax=Limosilactobacillus sp. TaxID=2773925 RepID=UPI003F0BA304